MKMLYDIIDKLIVILLILIVVFFAGKKVWKEINDKTQLKVDTDFFDSTITNDSEANKQRKRFTDNKTPVSEVLDLSDSYIKSTYTITSDSYISNSDYILAKVDIDPTVLPKSLSFSKFEYSANGAKVICDVPALLPINGMIIKFNKNGKKSLLDEMGNSILDDWNESKVFSWSTDNNGNNVFLENGFAYVYDKALKSFITTTDFVPFSGYMKEYLPHFINRKTDSDISIYYENGKYGYKKGNNVLINAEYIYAFPFNEGYGAAVTPNNSVYIFDDSGNRVFDDLNTKYDSVLLYDSYSAYTFDHGLMKIIIDNGSSFDIHYIDKYGKDFFIPKSYEVVSYSEGIFLMKKDDKYGYMKYDGSWIVSTELASAKPFSEGIGIIKNNDGRYGAIDKKGNLIIPYEYDEIFECSGGLMTLYSTRSGWTIIQKMKKF